MNRTGIKKSCTPNVLKWSKKYRILDFGVELQKLLSWVTLRANPAFRLVLHIVHLAISIWFFVLGIVQSLESFLIACDLFKRYEVINVSKVRYLAIVFDSEDARQTSKVFELLQWLADIGIKKVCLYDTEGVLKKSKEAIIERFSPGTLSKEATKKHLDLEFVSFSDGKEAVAKAANYLFVKHYATSENEKPNLTEPQMAEALAAIGSGGPEPDLLLVYGPTRSHLGFPAWRLRYTEIVHMGSLQSMKFGALVKAIHRFTMVKQNYGS